VPLVTRPPKSSGGPAPSAALTSDRLATALRALQVATAPLTAAAIKTALQGNGVSKAEIDRAWPALQKKIKANGHVVVANGRYQWTAQARPPDDNPSAPRTSASDALAALARSSRLGEARKADLVAIIGAALGGGDAVDRGAADLGTGAPEGPELRVAEARRRQAEIDAMRALAELASEVEELTANGVTPDVMVRQVRAWVKRSGLEPIGRAGEETAFDRKRHKPIDGGIRDGALVLVVRPGYVWKAPTEDVLIGKAVVEE